MDKTAPKMAPRLKKASVEAGADAITAINTVRAMAIDIETTWPILANRIGGLSGPAIKPIALRGLGVFKSITRGIDAYLKKANFSSVKKIVGLAHKS